MKDWEQMLQKRKEEGENERQRAQSEEEERKKLEQERLKRLREELDEKAVHILQPLGAKELLEEINELEWESKGEVVPSRSIRMIQYFVSRGLFENSILRTEETNEYETGYELGMNYQTDAGISRAAIRILINFSSYKEKSVKPESIWIVSNNFYHQTAEGNEIFEPTYKVQLGEDARENLIANLAFVCEKNKKMGTTGPGLEKGYLSGKLKVHVIHYPSGGGSGWDD